MATTPNLNQQLASASWGSIVVWALVGALFVWLGFMRHRSGFWWKVLGVIGAINILVALGEAGRRVGRTSTPSQ